MCGLGFCKAWMKMDKALKYLSPISGLSLTKTCVLGFSKKTAPHSLKLSSAFHASVLQTYSCCH